MKVSANKAVHVIVQVPEKVMNEVSLPVVEALADENLLLPVVVKVVRPDEMPVARYPPVRTGDGAGLMSPEQIKVLVIDAYLVNDIIGPDKNGGLVRAV